MSLKPEPGPLPASACARCGEPFTCGAVAGTPTCWCVAQPRLLSILPYQTCLCPACLALALKEEQDAALSHPASRQP